MRKPNSATAKPATRVANSPHFVESFSHMLVHVLGSAAGGGFPQWNCACPNCRALREGTFLGKPRTQTQVAISNVKDGRDWFLLGASPDLRAQIEATPALHPRDGVRQSPIDGVVLANADVDHTLGLLLLRELQPLNIYSTPAVRHILRKDNSMFAMLERIPQQAVWNEFTPGKDFPLRSPSRNNAGLRCEAHSLAHHFPAYVSPDRQQQLAAGESSCGLVVSSSGKRLAFFPAVPEINQSLLNILNSADVLLFDGTFWSDDELIRIQGSGQTARQMGHVPVQETLVTLAQLSRPRKIFLHINNTNPMLNESGPEYRAVRAAGWEIAEDGWQLEL